MTDTPVETPLIESEIELDPLKDAETTQVKNRARVGSARPSSLMYTYGPGAVMDLPNFSIMPAGLTDWEKIWARRDTIPTIVEPRLLETVRLHLGSQVDSLRPFPREPQRRAFSQEGNDLGVPSRVFPQWFRCTGCDYLGPLTRFTYSNEKPHRPDLATFTHVGCPGRGRARAGSEKGKKEKARLAVPAQHLLGCANGHLDEFPYHLWVHKGASCPKAPNPDLKMREPNLGNAFGSIVFCGSCGASRRMADAQGELGAQRLPQKCRGRHPHLGIFEDCEASPRLIMMGASNLWFPVLQSVIVMPRTEPQKKAVLAEEIRGALGIEKATKYADNLEILRDLLEDKVDVTGVSDAKLAEVVGLVMAEPDTEAERQEKLKTWDPIELLLPEWLFLQDPAKFPDKMTEHKLMVREVTERDPLLNPLIDRVVAVDSLKKVNALIGFTRIDGLERIQDQSARMVRLVKKGRPQWVPATEDRGEGVYLQLDLDAVATWEATVEATDRWKAHREAHERNFLSRTSATADKIDPADVFPPARYWLLHSFAHALIREMAMRCGYGSASLSERIYAWKEAEERPAAAGLLICTTASDSEGTLGGLVALSQPRTIAEIVDAALRRAGRCSSDPVCAMRLPKDPESFLHGAACHCCSFVSETSCEKANRFLDRRFLITLPGSGDDYLEGFFGSPLSGGAKRA